MSKQYSKKKPHEDSLVEIVKIKSKKSNKNKHLKIHTNISPTELDVHDDMFYDV